MLTRLKISNYLLIENIELDFKQGLTAITGETGSGKSIVIDALMIIFGTKVTHEIIRINKDIATFEATFTITHNFAIKYLEENDLLDLDNKMELICRRVIDRKGKNKLYINGNTVTIAQIKKLGELILDIHTQYSSITLLKPEIQQKLFDEYANLSIKVSEIDKLYRLIKDAENNFAKAHHDQEKIKFKKQLLNEQLNEFSELDLIDKEWENINIEHKKLANANFILQELNYLSHFIHEGNNSLFELIKKIQIKTLKLTDYTPKIENINPILESIKNELQEISYTLTNIARDINDDPNKLEYVENRISQIFTISRKYKILPQELEKFIINCQNELNTLEEQSNLNTITALLKELHEKYHVLATNISDIRQKQSDIISNKITNILHKLAIKGEFKVILKKLDKPNNYGLESIEYFVSFNKGMPLSPLAKVASGGELSRTALALYLLLSIHNPPEVIIFDEIDVGIGGKIASIVGSMLHELGTVKQVICITHCAQTASFANCHLQVSKNDTNNSTVTLAKYVEGQERIDEIARMIAGMNITPTTKMHAEEMLNSHH